MQAGIRHVADKLHLSRLSYEQGIITYVIAVKVDNELGSVPERLLD